MNGCVGDCLRQRLGRAGWRCARRDREEEGRSEAWLTPTPVLTSLTQPGNAAQEEAGEAMGVGSRVLSATRPCLGAEEPSLLCHPESEGTPFCLTSLPPP